MTSVVSIQALLFQDGGILSLGANLFNMAIVGVMVFYAVYTSLIKLLRKQAWGLYFSGFTAAWSSIFITSLACGLELALSGTSPANIAIPAMGVIHAVIGIGEGLITLGALVLIKAARQDLLSEIHGVKAFVNKSALIGGGFLALLLAILSPWASVHPDGLEWVAEQQGFIGKAQDALFDLLPDYTIPGISNPVLTTIMAGIIGLMIVFAVAYLFGRIGKRNKTRK